MNPRPGAGRIGHRPALENQLIELHGGQVAARSAGIGRGSEFVLRLQGRKIWVSVPN